MRGAIALVTLLALCAAGAAVGGVFLLAGIGWAMIAASAVLGLLATVLARGISRLRTDAANG